MCHSYSQTKSQDAMRHVFDAVLEADEGLGDSAGNLPPMPGIYPDYSAPITRSPRARLAAWHRPLGHADAASGPGQQAHRPGPGTGSPASHWIRNTGSPHWQR